MAGEGRTFVGFRLEQKAGAASVTSGEGDEFCWKHAEFEIHVGPQTEMPMRS